MFWIQQTGTNHNNSAYRLFYADYETDVANLPTSQKNGKQDNGDTVANQKITAGSECLVLESGNLYILSKDDDEWKGV